MFYRRRILMRMFSQENNNLIDYFKSYKVDYLGNVSFSTSWIGCRLKLQKPRIAMQSTNTLKTTIANLNSDKTFMNYYPIQSAIGYDPSKNYNLKIKLVNKNLMYQDELGNSGLLYFAFVGLDSNSQRCYKQSQELPPSEIQKGTEFIIPINSGEFLNNLMVHYYLPKGEDYAAKDSYTFTLVFEFYFEEITE